MLLNKTYDAKLVNGQLTWEGDAPPEARSSEGIRVRVEVLPPEISPEERGRRMKEALDKLAALGGFSDIPDPVAWQRELRKDRPLPGQENESD